MINTVGMAPHLLTCIDEEKRGAQGNRGNVLEKRLAECRSA
jgi:hypothetical protein